MKYLLCIILFGLIWNVCISQTTISKSEAIEIAIANEIKEPLDSFLVTIVNDTMWKVESLYCDDYYSPKTESLFINTESGLKENYIEMTYSIKYHSHPRPKTVICRDTDSLIICNQNKPRILLPDFFEKESNTKISPDNKWIAFQCGFRKIAVASINGDSYMKICDSCLFPQWTEKENVLVYEKNFKEIFSHNIETNEIRTLTNDYGHTYFSYCPNGKWISYVKPVPRKSNNPFETVVSCKGDDYELFVKSLINGTEKRITFEGSVHLSVWNRTSDTIFFYMDSEPFYATNFKAFYPTYGKADHLSKININDYTNSIGKEFILKSDCQLVMVNKQSLKLIKYILKKRDRYENIELSRNGRLIVYTLKKGDKEKIYIIEND